MIERAAPDVHRSYACGDMLRRGRGGELVIVIGIGVETITCLYANGQIAGRTLTFKLESTDRYYDRVYASCAS